MISACNIQHFNTGAWNSRSNPDDLWNKYYAGIRIANEFIENVTKKNVEKKLHQLLTLMVKVLESDDEDGEVLVLDEADRLKSLLLNDYIKILGEDYRNKIIKRIDYIVREFKTKKVKNREEVIEKSGKSR